MAVTDFYCSDCWSSDAVAALVAIIKIPDRNRVIGESQFYCRQSRVCILKLKSRSGYGRSYRLVDSEDSVCCTVLPFTDGEKLDLVESNPVLKADLESICTDRRSLKYDRSKEKPQRIY